MVISLYEELMGITTLTQSEVKQKLIDLNIAHIFSYVVEKYEDKNWLKAIVQFAAGAYSWESKMVTIGMDWRKNKKRIAERVNLPPEAYDLVVELKDERLADVFRSFMALYTENRDYVHLMSLNDLYQQIMANATKFVMDEAGNANMEKKFADIKRADDLKEKIEELEEKIKKKYRQLDSAKSELKYDQREHGNPLKVENSRMIRS